MENKAKLFFTFMALDHKLKWKKEPLALQLVTALRLQKFTYLKFDKSW